jgi:cytochrome c556
MTRQLATLALICLFAVPAWAQPDPEDVVAYRQSIYQVIKWNYGELRAMLGGEQAYDATKAARAADFIASAAPMLSTAYIEGSITSDSAALPKIWEDWQEFSDLLARFQSEAKTLGEVDASDQVAMAEQIKNTGGVCKQCHDTYKD